MRFLEIVQSEDLNSPGAPSNPAARSGNDSRELLPRHLQGDSTAFAELLGLYRHRVAGYLARCGVPPAARDDVFQEIFVKIHRAAHAYSRELPLEPWLFTIVANTTRSFYRRESSWGRLKLSFSKHRGESANVSGPDLSQESICESKQTAQWLEQQIALLPPTQREVLALVSLKHLSLKEVAEVLNMPLGTVKTNLHRARLTLAKALAQRSQIAVQEVGDE